MVKGEVAGWPSPASGPDLPTAHTFCCASYHYRQQVAHSHQVVGRGGPSKHPSHSRQAAEACLTHQGYRLEPTEDFLHPLPFPLTDRVARMPGGPLIDGTPPRPSGVLRYMRRDLQISQGGHQLPRVIILIARQSEAVDLPVFLHHGH